jgi:hypothetical protein
LASTIPFHFRLQGRSMNPVFPVAKADKTDLTAQNPAATPLRPPQRASQPSPALSSAQARSTKPEAEPSEKFGRRRRSSRRAKFAVVEEQSESPARHYRSRRPETRDRRVRRAWHYGDQARQASENVNATRFASQQYLAIEATGQTIQAGDGPEGNGRAFAAPCRYRIAPLFAAYGSG